MCACVSLALEQVKRDGGNGRHDSCFGRTDQSGQAGESEGESEGARVFCYITQSGRVHWRARIATSLYCVDLIHVCMCLFNGSDDVHPSMKKTNCFLLWSPQKIIKTLENKLCLLCFCQTHVKTNYFAVFSTKVNQHINKPTVFAMFLQQTHENQLFSTKINQNLSSQFQSPCPSLNRSLQLQSQHQA